MKNKNERKFNFNVLIIFVICTVLSFAMALYIINSRVKSKKDSAKYTAEATARRVQSEIDTYLVAVEVLKNHLVAYGEEKTLEKFEHLSDIMLDNAGVIKCIELAKDGVVTNIYPKKGNEEALGLNLLMEPMRNKEASLAKESREYTFAGPYKLRQSDQGALLLNPVYIPDEKGEDKFWGFTVLVIDWDKFREKINIDKLEESGYVYNIWRDNPYGEDRCILEHSKKEVTKSAIKVRCEVPNDTWYVEIMPKKGWYSVNSMLQQLIVAIIIPILGTIGTWMYVVNKQHEKIYQINLEKARNKAEEASRAKTRFLCSMSHDIRTPLNAVLGFTRIAKENITNKDMLDDSLNKVEVAGKHLLNLINDVLNVSSIESGIMKSNMKQQNLRQFGDELVAIFEQEMIKHELDFSIKYDTRDENVLCDAHHIREICVNLLSNAMKFTEAGGKVICIIKQLSYIDDDKCTYEIEISDTGIGMSKEFQEIQYQLFERERTDLVSSTEGTGLGLPIVKRLVEMLNGEIDCDSEIGRGTTYKIRFDFQVISKLEGENTHEKNNAGELKCKRVLLVEDVDLNREIAEYMLEDMGLEVESVVDGKEAVDRIAYVDPGYYDVVLMDIQMPVMDGYEATRRIRALEDSSKASINIYAMTANAFEEDKQKALKAGMNGHLAKPIEEEKVYRALLEC